MAARATLKLLSQHRSRSLKLGPPRSPGQEVSGRFCLPPQSYLPAKRRLVRTTGFAMEQFDERILKTVHLPNELSEPDLLAVARIHFQDLPDDYLSLVVKAALATERNYVSDISKIATLAKDNAREEGRERPLLDDIEAASLTYCQVILRAGEGATKLLIALILVLLREDLRCGVASFLPLQFRLCDRLPRVTPVVKVKRDHLKCGVAVGVLKFAQVFTILEERRASVPFKGIPEIYGRADISAVIQQGLTDNVEAFFSPPIRDRKRSHAAIKA